MTIEEIKEFIESNKENEEVQEFINSFKVVEKDTSLELFKEKLESDKDFKSFMDSLKDQHLSKALETWKSNNLQKLIDEKVKELYPEQDPKDLELQKMKQEIENMKKETLRKELTNKALKIAQEKGLPSDLVDYFIGNDEETTLSNLGKLEEIFNSKLEVTVKERLKGEGYTPPKSDNSNTITKEDFMKMGYQERVKLSTDNPDLYQELSK